MIVTRIVMLTVVEWCRIEQYNKAKSSVPSLEDLHRKNNKPKSTQSEEKDPLVKLYEEGKKMLEKKKAREEHMLKLSETVDPETGDRLFRPRINTKRHSDHTVEERARHVLNDHQYKQENFAERLIIKGEQREQRRRKLVEREYDDLFSPRISERSKELVKGKVGNGTM